MDPSMKFTLTVKELDYRPDNLSSKILSFLGRIGGFCHNLISSDYQLEQVDKQLARTISSTSKDSALWDFEAKILFPLPLLDKKIDVNLAKVLPIVLNLVLAGTNQRVKTHAAELLHAITVFMIGKSAQRTGQRGREKNLKKNFSVLYSKIFPVIFLIGSDSNNPNMKLFNTLALQITRWFSNTYEYEAPDLCALLDSLMSSIISKENSSLREFAACCIGNVV
jgi:DNA-dependent protein kinase catalytic subunit